MRIPREVHLRSHRRQHGVAILLCLLLAFLAILYFVFVATPPSSSQLDKLVGAVSSPLPTQREGSYPPVRHAPHSPPGLPRISSSDPLYAIADLHGDVEALIALLVNVSLIPSDSTPWSRPVWTGGKATLVQLGDTWDRGAHAPLIFYWLTTLAASAAAVGGSVVRLVGNHDVLNLQGVGAYVSPSEVPAYFGGSTPARVYDFTEGPIATTIAYTHYGIVASPAHDIVFVHGGLTRPMIRRWGSMVHPPSEGLSPAVHVGDTRAHRRTRAVGVSASHRRADIAFSAGGRMHRARASSRFETSSSRGSAHLHSGKAPRHSREASVADVDAGTGLGDARRTPLSSAVTAAQISPALYRAWLLHEAVMSAVRERRYTSQVLLDTGPLWDRQLSDTSPTGGCLVAEDAVRALNEPLSAEEASAVGVSGGGSSVGVGVHTIVVGHTPQSRARVACNGTIVLLDSMMSYAYGGQWRSILKVMPGGRKEIIEIPSKGP